MPQDDVSPKSRFWRKPTTCSFWTALFKRRRKREDSEDNPSTSHGSSSSASEQPTTSARAQKNQLKNEAAIEPSGSSLRTQRSPGTHLLHQGSLEEIQEVKLNEIVYNKLDAGSVRLIPRLFTTSSKSHLKTKEIAERKKYKKETEATRKQFFEISTYVSLAGIACLSSALRFMKMRDFMRGAVTTLLGLLTLDTLLRQITNFLGPWQPEHTRFKIPDYENMPSLEIPVCEMESDVRSYTGWMNEIDNYDPDNYHVSMTKPVFVQLDGTTLKLSSTAARIPKRRLWNERPINLNSITFTETRIYDLEGCSVDIIPADLHKKKYFKRKYPIQLTIEVNEFYKDDLIDDIGDAADLEQLVEHHTFDSKFEGNEEWHSGTERLSKSGPKDEIYFSASEDVFESEAEKKPAAISEEPIESEAEKKPAAVSEELIESEAENKPAEVSEEPIELEAPTKLAREVRLFLFSRVDREKEDWYRRFLAASTGVIHEQNLRLANAKLVQAVDLQLIALKSDRLHNDNKDAIIFTSRPDDKEVGGTPSASINTAPSEPSNKEKDVQFTIPEKHSVSSIVTDFDDDSEPTELLNPVEEFYEGLIMNSNIARNPSDYVNFMSNFQRACNQESIPVYRSMHKKRRKDQRKLKRMKNQENELWKGIDVSLFLGPSGSVVWFNVLIGRILFSCLHTEKVKEKVKELMQKKMGNLKLPKFMENVLVTEVNLGQHPPLIHRVSQPMLDERGTWIDADVTYDGYCYITMTTRINFRRLRKSTGLGETNVATTAEEPAANAATGDTKEPTDDETRTKIEPSHSFGSLKDVEALRDVASNVTEADAERESSDSDTESEEDEDKKNAAEDATSMPKRRRSGTYLRRLKQKLTPKNILQHAREISYVQNLMDKMNANILLRVDLHGMVARAVINLPPPPSDRVWLGFRGPPRLWLTARPTVRGKTVNMSLVTGMIESKLCDQINRALVYPNMLDVKISLLGQPTYEQSV